MKRIAVAASLLSCVFAGAAQAAPVRKLAMHEARSTAESAAFSFEMRRNLDSNAVGRCKRQAPRRALCLARAEGETDRTIRTCTLRIIVRVVYRDYYWDEAATIRKPRCKDEAKPLLGYMEARDAIQAAADAFAAQPTIIASLDRSSDVSFTGRAEWVRLNDTPKAETCSVRVVATLAATVATAIDGFHCH